MKSGRGQILFHDTKYHNILHF
uniref:Uncharacterized protein n=1 Tax=Anguilla anguilla TaxID=7936 RepID=A0A0E9TE59_ANGAN